jgi:hypothetical protein
MSARLALLLTGAVVLVISGWSQSPGAEISLGSKTLKLGMPKDLVIATLAGSFDLEMAGSEEFWSVASKPPYTVNTPYTYVGSVGFEAGKLVYVLKRRFDAGSATSATALARAFHLVLKDFLAEQGGSCKLDTLRAELLEVDERRVSIQCGLKVITIDTFHHESNDSVKIDETLGALHLPKFPGGQKRN